MRSESNFDERLRRVEGRHNARVKELRRLFREAVPNQQGEVAVEGMHLAEEAIRSGLRISTVFFSDSARQRAHKLLPQLSAHSEALLLPDDLFASAVPTETPQGVAAIVKVKSFALDDFLAASPALLLLAVGVQDPGNLGTMARSGEAFGAAGLLLGEGTVSPWNWKATRASAGSLFRLPSAKLPLTEALGALRSRGLRVLATSSHKGTPVWDADLRGAVAIVIGGEGAGLPKEIMAQADELIAIPQSARVESLNAGIAASVVLYEAARQRHRDRTVSEV